MTTGREKGGREVSRFQDKQLPTDKDLQSKPKDTSNGLGKGGGMGTGGGEGAGPGEGGGYGPGGGSSGGSRERAGNGPTDYDRIFRGSECRKERRSSRSRSPTTQIRQGRITLREWFGYHWYLMRTDRYQISGP